MVIVDHYSRVVEQIDLLSAEKTFLPLALEGRCVNYILRSGLVPFWCKCFTLNFSLITFLVPLYTIKFLLAHKYNFGQQVLPYTLFEFLSPVYLDNIENNREGINQTTENVRNLMCLPMVHSKEAYMTMIDVERSIA
ncbi:hypothetical protein K501DRAFT_273568 [Backusella circina FSU 941]|nr:hypothetical protein K501DRAFT_273568 [Backusella circina FSU 941]